MPRYCSELADIEYKKVQYYDNVEECMDAVSLGKADFGYYNSYSVNYCLSEKMHTNINIMNLPNMDIKFYFGVPFGGSEELVSILNKAIRTMDYSELQAFTVNNLVNQDTNFSVENYIKTKPLLSILVILVIGTLFILLIVAFFLVRYSANKRILSLTNNLSGGVINLVLNESMEIKYINEGFFNLIVHTREEWDENYGNDWAKHVTFKDEFDKMVKYIYECVKNNQHFHTELKVRKSNDEIAWIFIDGSLCKWQRGEPVIQAICMDITAFQHYTEYIVEKSKRDKMTGLYDRISTEEITDSILLSGYEHFVAGKEKEYCAMLVVDVDNFKLFNDTSGHRIGDIVIISVAKCLEKCFAGRDVLGRIGGDEFFVLIRNAKDIKYVEDKVAELLDDVREIEIEGVLQKITCSTGVLMFGIDDKRKYDDYFNLADKCLYDAKEKGRNCYVIKADDKME